jgi:predicted O-methyltransferase YrrM
VTTPHRQRILASCIGISVAVLAGCAAPQHMGSAPAAQTAPAAPVPPIAQATPLPQTAPAAPAPAGAQVQTSPAGQPAAQQPLPAEPERRPDVHFVPTPHETVNAMLDVAKVGPQDIVYDLGSGDGRIPIAAAKRGARAIGIDIDPRRIEEARANAAAAQVTDRVQFILGDLFKQDLSPATVVTLYLLPSLNVKLMPKLMAELPPGTRIVSHNFDMGDWKPEQTLKVGGSTVYYWTIPPKGQQAATAGAPR